jgi:predicted helicase
LRKVFNSLAFELPDELKWVVDDLTDLLKAAEIGEIKKDIQGFRKRRGKGDAEAIEKDPIIYFYEPFLAEYDPKERERRGVYYTPLPVVSYIVRSIDELLINEFDKPMGLADDDVIILDPACGTGTFLYEIFRVIYEKVGKRSKATWSNSYVPKLLKRVFGFELLMAPYTIAHLKLAEFLADETGYNFESDQRIGIYLTNTLEEAEAHTQQLRIGLEGTIATERAEADEVKERKQVMVILGNPPYSGHSQNKGKWIEGLLKKAYDLPDGSKRQSYYEVDGASINERNPKWLQDDYVKFLRWSQWRIDKTGEGILGMITNHGYLDNPTFRGMRQSLMGTFDKTYIYDIHGNSKKKETAPDGSKDENVFDIQQGVSIGLFIKNKP